MSTQFAGAIYFALFALLYFLFTKYTLLSLKDDMQLPFFPSGIFVFLIGGLIGRQFASLLAKKSHWLRSMMIGFIIAIVAILIAGVCVLIHSYFYDATFINSLKHWQNYFIVYGVIVLSITFVIGVWLIPLTGLAAIYFNKRFLPGLLAVDNIRTPTKDKPPV